MTGTPKRSAPRLAAVRDLLRFDAHSALLPMPGMATLLLGGRLIEQPVAASIAAGAALSIGMGATRFSGGRRWRAMVLIGAGMVVAAFVGTHVGEDPVMRLATTALIGGIFGAIGSYGDDAWWFSLQLVVAFLVAAQFPGDPSAAVHRVGAVAAGAIVQISCVAAAVLVFGDVPAKSRTVTSPSGKVVRLHAARAATCIVAAQFLAEQVADIHRGYWAAMTAMIVLKPGLRDTAWRGLERAGGTVAGIATATVIGLLLYRWPLPLLVATSLFSGCAFGLQGARYAVLSGAITGTVLLIATSAGEHMVDVDLQRLFATLLGSCVAIAGAAIAPRRPFPLPDRMAT